MIGIVFAPSFFYIISVVFFLHLKKIVIEHKKKGSNFKWLDCLLLFFNLVENIMEKDFEPLKSRLRIICDRLDEDEQQYFRPLIDNFKGQTQEFQRSMRDLGKFGEKITDGSKFQTYREVQHLFDDAFRKKMDDQ